MTRLQRNWTRLVVREQFDRLLFRDEYMRRFLRASGDGWVIHIGAMTMGWMPSWKKTDAKAGGESSVAVT
jgi:hypothetical protein